MVGFPFCGTDFTRGCGHSHARRVPGNPNRRSLVKNTSAGSVQKYVDDKFTGKWGTYISKWERQFVKL